MTVLGATASCATPDYCVGWRPVTISEIAAVFLNENDPRALREIIAHYEHGQANGCW